MVDGEDRTYTSAEVDALAGAKCIFVDVKSDYRTLLDVGIEVDVDRYNRIFAVSDDANTAEFSLDKSGIIEGITLALNAMSEWRQTVVENGNDDAVEPYDDAIRELIDIKTDISRCI